MISRREWLGMSLGAGATLALSPNWLRALQLSGGKLLQRAIPSSGEKLPVISFGARPADSAAIQAVLRTLVDHGGRVVDVLHGGPEGEKGARAAAGALGLQDKLFWTTPLSVTIPLLPGYVGAPPKPDTTEVKAEMEAKFAVLQATKIDLVMVGTGADMPSHLAVLREMKKAGRVRYIGVHHLAFPANAPMQPFGELESIMRNEPIDFIGTDYSVGDRRLEEKLLPLAQERKIAVMAYFPFDRSRIFQRASSTPLPEWAAEFDAKSWAQFFLKYVLSHPAVTVARTGTTNAEHMLDNLGGGIGRLPNDAMRQRMAQFVDALPATPAPKPMPPPAPTLPSAKGPSASIPAAILETYVGEYRYVAANQSVTVRRDGERLFLKVKGSFPEGPLVALSETRFGTPWPGGIIEFQLDPEDEVTGAVVESGPYLILLERE